MYSSMATSNQKVKKVTKPKKDGFKGRKGILRRVITVSLINVSDAAGLADDIPQRSTKS